VLGRNSMTNILAAISVMALLVPSNSYAQATCASAPGPLQRVDAKIESWNLLSVAQHDCLRGVRVELTARKLVPGDSLPTASVDGPGQTAIFSLPIYCRRDDYMFLPPTTLGGLPCVSVPSSERVDPLEIALRMEAELPPPDLRIGMNPQKGMVAVPTWFWVEGYDGSVLRIRPRLLLTCVCGLVGLPGILATGMDARLLVVGWAIAVMLWANRLSTRRTPRLSSIRMCGARWGRMASGMPIRFGSGSRFPRSTGWRWTAARAGGVACRSGNWAGARATRCRRHRRYSPGPDRATWRSGLAGF
jgi:hypothetical protein